MKNEFKNFAKQTGETIVEHTFKCYKISKVLCEIFKSELNNINLEGVKGNTILLLSVLLHDFGKYAQPFQYKTLNKESNEKWGFRHEILSAEFVNLLEVSEEVKNIIKLVILSHHNKTINQLEKAVFKKKSTPNILGIDFTEMYKNRKRSYEEGKNSIKEHWCSIKKEINRIWKDSECNIKINLNFGKLANVFSLIEDYYTSINGNIKKYDYDILIFFKGLLVTSDHLSSADESIEHIEDNIEEYYKKKFDIHERGRFNELQLEVLNQNNLKDVVIINAPTGSGKTEAALLWANKWLRNNKYARIFYILPYTASINAMYERLNNEKIFSKKIDLLHGKSIYYYWDLIKNNDTDDNIKEKIEDLKLLKLLAKTYKNPIKILTPHQIIKYFYGLKHFEEAILEYRNSLFIFDEIHCYDKNFLAELIIHMKYIYEKLNGKFLFMSATFPKFLQAIIKDNFNVNLITIKVKKDVEKFTKIKLKVLEGFIEDDKNLKLIQNDLNDGKKVLVVCNTIKKAQLLYDKLNCNDKLLLHSAFTLKDRKEIEKKILERENKKSLNKKAKGQLLIGTQVIEVSLDIDYDVGYSEIASIDALIQRFGRVYRNRKRRKDEYGLFYLFKEADEATKLIYNEDIFDFVHLTKQELEKCEDKTLDFSIINEIINNVFSKDYAISVKKTLTDKLSIFKNFKLIPMKDYSSEAQEYFGQFDGVKILPIEFFEEYEKLIEKGNYVEAEKLFVTLTERKVFSYFKKNFLSKIKILDNFIYITNNIQLSYNSTKGLFIKEQVTNATIW